MFEGGRVAVVDMKKWVVVFEETYAIVPYSLAWSPDGRTLAVATTDPEVKIWDTKKRMLRRSLVGHTKEVRSVAFSANGEYLATGSGDKTVKLWEASSGDLVRTLEESEHPIHSVCFTNKGNILLARSYELIEPQFTVWMWDMSSNMKSGRILRRIREDAPDPIAFSPDSRWMAIGAESRMDLVRWPTAETVAHFKTDPIIVGDAVFSADSTLLAIADKRKVLMVDVRRRRLIGSFGAHEGFIDCLAFGNDGSFLISADGQEVKVWKGPFSKSTFPRELDK